MSPSSFTFKPLTPLVWRDFETLFGDNGACAGCWCMWMRMPTKEFRQKAGAARKRAMKKLVASGTIPGLIAYAGGEPVGWVAVAPRSEYIRLANSRVLAPVDEKPVWSVTCFFVRRDHRKQGLTVELLQAAFEFARKHGAQIVEGYPHEVTETQPASFVWAGLLPAFLKAGFKEVARRSKSRPVMRACV